MSPSELKRLLAFCGVFAPTAASASAQDLFELEVFTYETFNRVAFDYELRPGTCSANAAPVT